MDRVLKEGTNMKVLLTASERLVVTPPFSSSLVDDAARVETGGGQGGEANGQGSVTLRLRDVLRRLRSNPRSRC